MGLSITPAFATVTLANRTWPNFVGPTNTGVPTQGSLWSRRILAWWPSNVGAGNITGLAQAMASAGTAAVVNPSNTNIYTSGRRESYASVVTTTNQQVGITGGDQQWSRSASAGQGGFFFVCRFGFETWTAGDRLFVGLAAATNALVTGQPSAVINMLGFGIDASDTAITFMHNDGSGTAVKDTIAGQPALASNNGYVAYIFCKPNDTVVYYRLDDLNAGTNIIDTSTSTDLPATGQLMSPASVMGNAANTVAGNAKLGNLLMYIECDV